MEDSVDIKEEKFDDAVANEEDVKPGDSYLSSPAGADNGPLETSELQEQINAIDTNNNDNNNSENIAVATIAEMDDDNDSANATCTLLTCSFNQDGGCLAIGTSNGFSVHNVHPQYSQSVQRILHGGIGVVEMLFRCNLMALVGGGSKPHGAPHRVLIWDDHIPKEIGELSFRQTVLAVKLRKDAIAIALRDRAYVYRLADLSLRDKIYTADNPHGLLSVSTQVQDMVLACPSVTTGQVRVELYGLRKTVLLEAHDSSLRGLALTADGSKVATASMKGTIIRIWSVSLSCCIQEFRRGVERASITSLAWSWDASWLACTSDKGTCHVFHVNNNNNNVSSSSSSSSSTSLTKRFFKSVTSTITTAATSASSSSSDPNRKQEKSVCQIRGIPHPLTCSFVSDATNIISVAGWDADGNGVLLVCEFVAHQEPRRIAYHVLVASSTATNGIETEDQKRRRRLRGWKPKPPNSSSSNNNNAQETAITMHDLNPNNFVMDEDDDEFITVTTTDDFDPEILDQPPPTTTTTPALQETTTTTTTTLTTNNANNTTASNTKQSQDETTMAESEKLKARQSEAVSEQIQ